MYKRQSSRRQSSRQGVILLIVLGMLAMFALIGITFVLLSGHARRSAVSQAKVDQANNPPDRLTDNVLMQVLRGSNDPASVLRPHGLLEDLYGNGWAEGQLSTAPVDVVTGGQLLSFMAIGSGTEQIAAPYQKYVGCVLTMTSGNAAGESTRIVGFDAATGFHILRFDSTNQPANGNTFIINGAPFSGTGFGYDPNAALAVGAETNPLLTMQDPAINNQPFALLPNSQTFTPKTTIPQYTDPAGPGGANEDYDAADYQNMLLASLVPLSGTPNVAIPIPSLHRPSLVNYWFHQLDTIITWPPTPAGLTDDEFRLGIFLHPYGPDNKLGDGDDITDAPLNMLPNDMNRIIALKRRIILRPLPEDHPNFTGGNQDFIPLWDWITNPVRYDANYDGAIGVGESFQPQWDVDNDGDGIMDSIWVDVGLPVRTMRDGRQYKPLAAILCVDMDGRLNLNAHGSLAQTAVGYGSPQPITTNIVAGPLNNLDVPRGQGVGPAEVNLSELLPPTLMHTDPDYAALTQYEVLLRGLPDLVTPTNPNVVPGRYGGNFNDDVPGRFVDPASQLPYYDYPSANPLVANKYFNCPGLYDVSITFDPTKNSGTMSYGTPVDFTGGACVGLDLRGQPLYVAHESVSGTGQFIGFHVGVGLRAANPYALSLSDTGRGVTRVNSSDTPFSVAELETILRPYDHDGTMLPGRLATLAPTLADHRFEVTTESWSIPCPAVTLPPELRVNAAVQNWFDPLNKANSLADILRAKIVEVDGGTTFNDSSLPGQINPMEVMVATLFPKELIGGLRMDLNRPFGNGRDDSGDGVIDEAGEVETFYQVDAAGAPVTLPGPAPIPFYAVPTDIDYDGDGDIVDGDAADMAFARQHSMARQLYARHLYVMMLSLMNFDPADANAEDDARTIAQWAVNVVDFRDRDSIMTGFEYDVNPFDGWDVDGDFTTDAAAAPIPPGTINPNVVWGCERPEMLITETLAFHDRRTRNLDVDGGIIGRAGATDTDYDQENRPQGSLFVELYNPWTDQESLPGELYQTVGVHRGINLRAMAGNSPVWRMIVVEGTITDDPDDPTLSSPVNIERSIYFVEPGFAAPAHVGDRFYPDPADLPLISPLKPGRYAVVGPGVGPGTSNISTTYVGFRPGCVPPLSPSTPLSNYSDTRTRRIVLEPSNNADDVQVQVFGNGDDPDLHPTTAPALAIQEPIAVVINPSEYAPNQPKRLSVSEPFTAADRYPAYTDIPNEKYAPVLPDPLDADIPANMDSGTFPQYRWIYLQRLANPLTPYDALANPYRVIDKAQIDLTAFNGLIDDSTGAAADTTVTNNNPNNFFTRERGEDEETQAGAVDQPNNIWAVELDNAQPQAQATNSNIQSPNQMHFFNGEFAHTLGYLNEGFGAPLAVPTDPTYDGSPPKPFPWLTWLNRPFLSEMEMMLVPKERSSQFLNQDATNNDKFAYPTVANPAGSAFLVANQPYGHLINWFYDDDTAFPLTDNPNWKLHRLLEYVRVPSPFVGTELQGAPNTFMTGTHDFNPPFNHISKRRDPGRVNLNTITSDVVWNGVAGEFDPAVGVANPPWATLVESRGGYAGADMFTMDDTLPTRFANPFRSFAGYYNVPNIPNTPPNPPNNELQDAIGSEVNATLLRSASLGGVFTNKPLFEYASTSSPINNTDRNPYFRYQELNRLGSTATNRSNVYAVWVTVGYFEVEATAWQQFGATGVDDRGLTQAQFQKIYPDGFQLGQELGSDMGDITRNRSFYMIDRSIPVGFQRGEDLNTEDAILLRRFIE